MDVVGGNVVDVVVVSGGSVDVVAGSVVVVVGTPTTTEAEPDTGEDVTYPPGSSPRNAHPTALTRNVVSSTNCTPPTAVHVNVTALPGTSCVPAISRTHSGASADQMRTNSYTMPPPLVTVTVSGASTKGARGSLGPWTCTCSPSRWSIWIRVDAVAPAACPALGPSATVAFTVARTSSGTSSLVGACASDCSGTVHEQVYDVVDPGSRVPMVRSHSGRGVDAEPASVRTPCSAAGPTLVTSIRTPACPPLTTVAASGVTAIVTSGVAATRNEAAGAVTRWASTPELVPSVTSNWGWNMVSPTKSNPDRATHANSSV